jgi:beta-galactosidase
VEYRGLPRSRPVLATQSIPWKSWGGDTGIPVAGELSFTDSSDVFTVSSPDIRLSFDKESGWIRQYTVKDQTWLADSNGLRPALPVPPRLQLFSTSTGSRMVIVRTEYTVPELSSLLHLSYTINASGALLVEQTLETDTSRPDSTHPAFDRFGINWTLPFTPDSITWYGFAGEDKADSLPSIHRATSSAQPSALRWCIIQDRTGKGFRLTADSNLLYFSPITPTANTIQIDAPLAPHPTVPFYYHYGFKLTPVASRTSAKPI